VSSPTLRSEILSTRFFFLLVEAKRNQLFCAQSQFGLLYLLELRPSWSMLMASDPVSEAKSYLKNPLLYSSAVLVVALLSVVFVMISRWQDSRKIERQAAQERAEKQHEQDRMAVEQLGGKDFRILSFYASPTVIRRGESARLCYGVSNAKTVKLQPQAQPVWPSVARCVDVSPNKSTTYTLTMEDGAGHSLSQDVEVKVR
jgi:hypothetical protein